MQSKMTLQKINISSKNKQTRKIVQIRKFRRFYDFLIIFNFMNMQIKYAN